MPRVAVIGSASWGTTLGIVLARKGTYVKLWTRTAEEADELNESRENATFLPGFRFPSRLVATSSIEEAVDKTDAIILAVPAQTMRQNIRQIKDYLDITVPIVSATKGLEVDSGKRMSEIIADELGNQPELCLCALSGPTVAQEMAQGLHSVAVVAAHDIAVAEKVRKLLMTKFFCLFPSTDIVGVELGGAVKNVIALGAGMADGLGYGSNTKAAFILRGLGEMMSLGIALKAEPSTFIGPAGMGDMITTSFSPFSRNHYVGVELAKGRPLEETLHSMHHTAEGITTSLSIRQMAEKLKMSMPITETLCRVLYEGLSPRRAIKELIKVSAEQEFALIQSASHMLTPAARKSRWHSLTLGLLPHRKGKTKRIRFVMSEDSVPALLAQTQSSPKAMRER